MNLTQHPIEIEARNVYGKTAYYVVSIHAEAVAKLTGKKTIDHGDMLALEALGFTLIDTRTAIATRAAQAVVKSLATAGRN